MRNPTYGSQNQAQDHKINYGNLYPQKVSLTPVKRRLDYKAALGIVDASPKKNNFGSNFQYSSNGPKTEEESYYTESGESEYSDDYTLEEDEYSDESSYYDESDDESYERALSVFSRRVNQNYGPNNAQRSSPYSIRDSIQNHRGALTPNKNIYNQERTPQNQLMYPSINRRYQQSQDRERARSYAPNLSSYRAAAQKTFEKSPQKYTPVKTPTKSKPFYLNNYLRNSENNENIYNSSPQQETKLKPSNPYLLTKPTEKMVHNDLEEFTNHLMSSQDPRREIMEGTCIFQAVSKCSYTNLNDPQKPHNFAEYMRSARQEYTKALRLLRQLKDSSQPIGDPEPFYMKRRYTRSKTLLLDMDETLIHSEEFQAEKYKRGHPEKYDFVVELFANGRTHKIGVYIRPYCMDFLRKMAKKFEVVIFTAARQDYADKILDKLDHKRTIFAGRMYRQHCTEVDGSYVKDLSVIKNRRKEDCILVDNLVYSLAGDLDRGIHILNFYDDKTDTELKYLTDALEKLQPYMNTGEYLEKTFGFQRFYDYL